MSTLAFGPSVAVAEHATITAIIDGFGLAEPVTAQVEVLAGGASNANYLLTRKDGERLVLRVAAQAVERFGIDRRRGVAAHQSVAAIGLAPAIAAVTLPAGHLLSAFADGPVLDAEGLRDPTMLERVGRTVRAVHEAGAIDGRFSVFADQRRYTAIARAEGLALPADIDELNAVADRIEALFEASATPDRLCHNDLQLPNFIIQPDRLVVLDWEYAGMGNPYFDLGATSVNADLDEDDVCRLTTAYFGGIDPVDDARVELMMFMSALREATWAVVAAPALALDWDYGAWAAAYYDRCRRAADRGVIGRALARGARGT